MAASFYRREQRLHSVPGYRDPFFAYGLIVSFAAGLGGSPAIGFPS
jgi:hypothetical protein